MPFFTSTPLEIKESTKPEFALKRNADIAIGIKMVAELEWLIVPLMTESRNQELASIQESWFIQDQVTSSYIFTLKLLGKMENIIPTQKMFGGQSSSFSF